MNHDYMNKSITDEISVHTAVHIVRGIELRFLKINSVDFVCITQFLYELLLVHALPSIDQHHDAVAENQRCICLSDIEEMRGNISERWRRPEEGEQQACNALDYLGLHLLHAAYPFAFTPSAVPL